MKSDKLKIFSVTLALINIAGLFFLASTTGGNCGSPGLGIAFPCKGPFIFSSLAIGCLIVSALLTIKTKLSLLLTILVMFDILVVTILTYQQITFKRQQITESSTINTAFYIPTYIPDDYINIEKGIFIANDMGKYAARNEKQFVLQYYVEGLQAKDYLVIKEVRYKNNFNPNADCSTPGSINVTVKCETIITKNGNTIYWADGIAYIIKDTTFIFIYYSNVNKGDLSKLVDSIKRTTIENTTILAPCWRIDNFLCVNSRP